MGTLHWIFADPLSGRTVRVQNRDLSEAFRQLRVILSRNRVPQTFHYQKRHERKGDRRRRLRSENWRKAFKNEVRTNLNSFSQYANPILGSQARSYRQHYSPQGCLNTAYTYPRSLRPLQLIPLRPSIWPRQ